MEVSLPFTNNQLSRFPTQSSMVVGPLWAAVSTSRAIQLRKYLTTLCSLTVQRIKVEQSMLWVMRLFPFKVLDLNRILPTTGTGKTSTLKRHRACLKSQIQRFTLCRTQCSQAGLNLSLETVISLETQYR